MSKFPVSCSCENIVFDAKPVIDVDNIHLNCFDLKHLKKSGNKIFEFRRNSILIAKLDDISSCNHSDSCFDVTCTCCKSSFVVCVKRSVGYVTKKAAATITSTRPSQPNIVRPLNLFFPPRLKAFYCPKNDDTCPNSKSKWKRESLDLDFPIILGDPDFSLMFGGSKDAIVGSYVEGWIDNDDLK